MSWISELLKGLKKKKRVAGQKPVENKSETPGIVQPAPPPVKKELTSEDVMLCLEKHLFSYDDKREVKENRADWIDTINNWIAVKIGKVIGSLLGKPYCISGLLYCIYLTEKELGIKFDLPISPSTQSFWRAVKDAYKIYFPKRFCFGIMQVIKDPDRGHGVYSKAEADSHNEFPSFEFNTNSAGAREGEGAMHLKRHTRGTSTKKFLGYVDLSKCWSKVQ